MSGQIGVVVMAYGTPAAPGDVEAYYTHIRRGQAPSIEQLANLQMRYDALGGMSTLAARTRGQLDGIAHALEELAPGRFRVALGQKHAAPFIEDGVGALADEGVERIVGLVLAPHYSGFSVGQYHDRAATAAAAEGDVGFVGIERWHDLPEYRAFLGDAVRDALTDLPARTRVVFTAHSLPERVLAGDPYPDELRESAQAVANMLDLDFEAERDQDDRAADEEQDDADTSWSQAWQSAGATPEPWRGPDILAVIRDLAKSGDDEGILVCPQGFVADHLEVAYDLDIEARRVADEAGIEFARTRVLNDDATVLAALACRVATVADA